MLTMAQIQYIKHLRDKKDKSCQNLGSGLPNISISRGSCQAHCGMLAIHQMINAENIGPPTGADQTKRYFVAQGPYHRPHALHPPQSLRLLAPAPSNRPCLILPFNASIGDARLLSASVYPVSIS